jgi:predicted permease
MNWLRRLGALWHRNRLHRQTDEELAFHIEAIERELIEQGMSATEAHRQARLRFGGSDSIEERVHAEASFPLESVAQDVRYAVRVLRKTPVFAAVVVLSLALGIGANVAIFSVLNAVMLKSVPVVDPDRLVILSSAVKNDFFAEKFMHDYEGDTYVDEHSGLQVGHSMPNVVLENVRKQSTVFEDTFAFASNDQKVNAVLGGRAEAGTLQGVSGGFFDGLGVVPVAGRLLVPSDDDASAPPVVVVGYKFFVNQLGGDASVVGKTISVNNTPAQIVGIAPPDFFGLDATVAPDFWIPLSVYRAQWSRTSAPETNLDDPFNWWLTVVGRLKPRATLEQAQAETAVLFARTINAPAVANDPTIPAMKVQSASRGLSFLRRRYSSSLWLLASIAVMVLLVACANVAALTLARTASRKTEVATRLSLGAARSRVVRQLMTESLLLALVAGVAGILLSYSLTSILLQLLNNHRDPVSISVTLGPLVLLFGFGISLLCGLVFGLAPALGATKVPIGTTLKKGGTTHSGESRFWTGKALVATQIALCVLLVAVAGLMARTLYKLQSIDLGFRADSVVAFTVRPGLNGYSENKLSTYYDDFLNRVATLPGVSSATYAQFSPVGEGYSSSLVYIPGFNTKENRSTYYRHIVGDHYFETLGIPLLLGRPLDEQDTHTAKLVIVINETMMRKYFAGQNPIGRQVVMGARKTPITYEIVGVARDVRYGHIRDEVPPTVYFSLRQNPFVPEEVSFFLRTTGDLRPLQNTLSSLALQLDPSVPAVNFREETSVIERHLSLERAFARLSSGFAGVGLLLACIGLYGTMAYMVAQRTREIGVRLALGAGRGKILGMVLGDTFGVVLAGLVIGLPATWFFGRALRAQLYGLSPHDSLTLGVAVAVLLLVTFVAGMIPAKKAASIDPMSALRCE